MVGLESAVADAGVGSAVAKYTGLKQVTGAAQNLSWLLVILGFVHYFLRIKFGFTSGLAVTLVFSLTLCFVSVYALSAKLENNRYAILIPTIVFLVWYFIFGANYEPSFLIYFLSIIGVIFLIPLLFSKGSAISAELMGLVPVLFLFLDVGLIPFLVERLNWPITPLIENLVLYMPWWSFLGLLTLPSEASKNGSVNFLVSATKIIGVIYIMFIIVAPAVPDMGYDKSLLPEVGEFEEAQAKLRARLPQTENPGWSNFQCILKGRYADIPVCVKERQENSEIAAACTNEGNKKGTPLYDDCVENKKKEKKEELYSAAGFYTPSVKLPTTAKIEINKDQLAPEYNPQWGYTAEIEIKNPGKQEMSLEVLCEFTDNVNKVTFSGTIDPISVIDFSDENFGETFICNPGKDKEFKGHYTLDFSLKMKGLETKSYLQRAFIGKKSIKDKEKVVSEIKAAKVYAESFSAKEFARINFFLGHTRDNVVIEDKVPLPVLVLTLDNLGQGKIIKVENYYLDFGPIDFGFQFQKSGETNDLEDFSCKSGKIDNLDTKKKKFTFKQCRLKDYPYKELSENQWERVTFEATLNYDYLINKKVSINIDPEKIVK